MRCVPNAADSRDPRRVLRTIPAAPRAVGSIFVLSHWLSIAAARSPDSRQPSSTATVSNDLPSSISSDAPPPVETWLTLSA